MTSFNVFFNITSMKDRFWATVTKEFIIKKLFKNIIMKHLFDFANIWKCFSFYIEWNLVKEVGSIRLLSGTSLLG